MICYIDAEQQRAHRRYAVRWNWRFIFGQVLTPPTDVVDREVKPVHGERITFLLLFAHFGQYHSPSGTLSSGGLRQKVW